MEAVLAYGVRLTGEQLLPYRDRNSLERWWREEMWGFKPSRKVYKSDGSYSDQKPTRDDVEQYWKEVVAFERQYPFPDPFPAEIADCTDDLSNPAQLLAVPGTVLTVNSTAPEDVKSHLALQEEWDEAYDELRKIICNRCAIGYNCAPRWHLLLRERKEDNVAD